MTGALAPAHVSASEIDLLDVPRFETIGAEQIPRGVVASIAQDRDGFLWLATGDGLVRYDGYRFRPIERDSPDPMLRNLGWIRALLAGRDGRVWIGTEADGLAVYEPATDRVRDVAPAGGSRQPRPAVRALAEGPDGAIWIGSVGGGLERFDPASGQITIERATGAPGALPDDRVLALRVDQNGALWVGTWTGLARRDPASGRFEPMLAAGAPPAGLAGRNVQAIAKDSLGRLWIGTAQGELARLDPASGELTWIASPATAPQAAGAVSAIAELPGGRIWVARSTGIDLHALVDGRPLAALRHDPRRRAGLGANEVTGLLVDRAGSLWVIGLGLGLQRHSPSATGLRVREADADPASAFAEPSARSLAVLDNGEIWLASAAGGLVVMDARLRAVAKVPLPRSPRPGSRLPREAASSPGGSAEELRADALVQATDGTVWVATGLGLQQMSRDRAVLRTIAWAGPLHRIFAARDGTLWLCAHDGLHRLPRGASAVQRVTRAAGDGAIGEAFAVDESADGTLWVGTSTGLFRIERGTTDLRPVDSPDGDGLGSSVVIGVLVDRQQRLWLDTAVTGLHRMISWDGQLARFDRVSARHGILGRPYGVNLLDDARGRIWTQQYVYDPRADRIDELTLADGKDIGTGWFHAYARLADGRMLFAGSKGLLVVEAERFAPSDYTPRLVVSNLRINGESQPAAPTLSRLDIEPWQRSFSLRFAALEFSDPARVRYATQLQGFDPEWIGVGAEDRSASYSSLPPGEYQLKVRATNRSGVWSPHELSIDVLVHPAWWQTPWAVAFGVLLAAAAVQGLVRLRTAQLRTRQRELEENVRQRTAELERLAHALQLESAALKESSLTDPLTGLRNRRYLVLQAGDEAALAIRRHEDAAGPDGDGRAADADLVFFLIDLDHFKRINDELGHAAGDGVLREVADRLRTVFREADALVRWGGEEFLAIARDASREHAPALAERVRAVVAGSPCRLAGDVLVPVTCSIGFAAFPMSRRHPRALDWSETVNIADAALYAAKAAGRNGWVGVIDAGDLAPGEWPSADAAARWPSEPRATVVRSAPAASTSGY